MASSPDRRPGYAELQVTTNFSFLRGAAHPAELVLSAAALGHGAIAITDRNSLAGIVRAHQAAKEVGIRLVVGCRLDLGDGPSLLAFPPDRAAYGRLTRLLTLGKRRAAKGECRLDYADVVAHGEGQTVILLPPETAIREEFRRFAARVAADFAGRGYLAAHHLYRGDDARRLADLAALAETAGLPLVATNDVLYHVPERRPLQDVLTCIRAGCTIDNAGFRLAANAERHLKSPAEMARLFRGHEDAVVRSLEIAARCRFSLDELRYEYPDETAADGRTPQQRLAELAWAGAAKRFSQNLGSDARPKCADPEAVMPGIGPGVQVATNGAAARDQGAAVRDRLTAVRFGPAHAFAGHPQCSHLLDRSWPDWLRPSTCPGRGRRAAWLTGTSPVMTMGSRGFAPYCSRVRGTGQLRDKRGHDDRSFRLNRSPPTAGLHGNDKEKIPEKIPEKIRHLIAHELQLIERLDYARYFLTVHDIVEFARSRGILCQGRGSAANSVVCYCLGITAVDPARIDVLFERFISAARNEPPDIDVDFEHERREEVIQYIYQKYGRDRAGLAATVISYRSRSAIREVGKALGLSGDVVAALAGIVWGWSNDPIGDERVREAGLDPADRNLRRALDLAALLTGFPRHLSQHVGGFVITRGPLSELVPIENAAMADRTVIEWDKDDLDALGILKIDILALGMLTCIRKAFALIERHYGRRLELATVPAEDPAVYEMLSQADSLGVFQVESRAQMTMLPRLKPREFYDLVIEVAIVRPGPIQGDMVHPYLRRRSGREAVAYPSEELRQVLGKTLGVPLFQEQAMKIAIVGAGFAPEEADRLRRAMATFKRNGDIHLFRDKFVTGMVANGYASDFAERCFSQIEGFGTYGFPESHAASFALLVYVSAWIKCFYPEVFACALLNSQPMGFYAPAQIVRDAREHGVEVRAVDVNRSVWDCTLEPSIVTSAIAGSNPGPSCTGWSRASTPLFRASKDVDAHGSSPWAEGPRVEPGQSEISAPTSFALRLGLRQIKGLAEADAARLVAARGPQGYPDPRALWRRSGLGPGALERLAEADAFRSVGLDRRGALWALKALGQPPLPLFAAAQSAVIPGRPTGPSPESRNTNQKDYGTIGTARFDCRCSWVPGSLASQDPRNDSVEAITEARAAALLPQMPLGEHVVEDYRSLGLSLKRHPLAFLRTELAREGLVAAADLADLPIDRRLAIAGIVLIRQRPGSANGVVFITIEDETGVANLIVWPQILERFRRAALGATLLRCTGRLQREASVIHVVADHLADLTPRLNTLRERTGAAEPPVRLPKKPPGSDARDIIVRSRNFR